LYVLFSHACFIARYILTVSDHSAYYCVFDCATLGLRLEPYPPAANFYWKLNTSLLSDQAFQPAFSELWARLNALPDAGTPTWWDKTAKPAVRDFCIAFSKAVARRNAATRRFFTCALEKALPAGDWPTIDGCRDRLTAMDRHTAAGMAVRAHEYQLPDELPNIFLLAQEANMAAPLG
jgi:hypothetical protein